MSVPVSRMRELLESGKRVRGTFVKLAAEEVVEIVGRARDFAVVDLEHSRLTEGDALRLVHHGWTAGVPVVVRIPEVDRGLVNRLLEAGAAGIQLSTVRRSADVRALRDAALYAPDGSRSVSLSHSLADFGGTPLADYVAGAPPPLLVAQIETATTDDPLDEILAAGADVAFVGVTDLTVDYGFDAEQVRARVGEIATAAGAAGVTLGGSTNDERFRYVVDSADVAVLRKAYADG